MILFASMDKFIHFIRHGYYGFTMSEPKRQLMPDETTIKIKKTTRDRLAKLGYKGDSWDAIVVKLIDHYEATGARAL